MKCANPTCNHSIGLVSHRRGLFGKRPYCSKQCRDHLAVAPPPKCERATTYFEWLFACSREWRGGSRQRAAAELKSMAGSVSGTAEKRRNRGGAA